MKRITSDQWLPLLLGVAIAAAGWMQGWQWRQESLSADAVDPVEVVLLQQQVDQLSRENEALRSLAQGGGEFAVPPELVARVEKQLGLSFVSTPVIHRLAGEELRDRVKASLEARYGEGGLEDRQKAYQLIGWLGMEDNLAGQLAALRAVGARTWFDEVSGEGWVTDRFELANVPDQASLLRVLARILLEQHYPLAKGRICDDALRARDALHTGVAAAVESKFFQDNARSIGFMSLAQDTEANQLLLSLPPFIQGWSSFLSLEGKTYADQLARNGRDILVRKLHDPPQKTSDLMFLYERDVPERVVALPETPGEVVLEDQGGALGLRLWLDALGDVQASRDLAEAWLHDRWRLFATDDRSHHVVWCIELRDKAAADEACAAFCALGAAIVGLTNDLVLGQAVEGSDGTWLRVDRVSDTGLRLTRTSSEKILSAIR